MDGVNYLHVKVCFHSPQSAVMSASDLAAYRQNIALLQDGGVMLVATTRDNVSPSLVLELLRRVGGIIKVGIQSACTHAHNDNCSISKACACNMKQSMLPYMTSPET